MAKKKKTSYFRVVCPELGLVLQIKSVSVEEESKIYEDIRSSIRSSSENFKTLEYMKYLGREFVKDFDSLIKKYDEEDHNTIIQSIYLSVVSVYKALALDIVCSDLNADTFFAEEEELLKDLSSAVNNLKKAKTTTKDSPYVGTFPLANMEDIKGLETHIRRNIIGQEEAIESVLRSVKLMTAGLSPQCSLFMVGPTGVGKTELSRLLGDAFEGRFFKVNCAEYAGHHEYAKLIGSPPGYIGHSEKSLLAEKAAKSNAWVFLFDEIEKANSKLYDFLLSLLDDGTCTDNLGKTLDFRNSIFLFTSNKGIREMKGSSVGFDRKETEPTADGMKEQVMEAVRSHFSPEFLNRLDDIVFFNPLNEEEIRKIAKLNLRKLPISVTEALLDYVVEGGYSVKYGARNIQRFIKNNVSTKVADAILLGRRPKNRKTGYNVRIVQGEVKIVNTYQESEDLGL